ncbi:hypothetical protein A2382_03170 [Candidatus Woesebacteria bacterium RIFOXYB1_FULL_38_16]|uniref:Uncharacterized protein n=1 Tax=Candidatus Woesebacteria bacterium RIFOXYB1_FULL_38_16 TaxID=1802538 RepID=A0A1F8CUE3_9BACT|nr:MAG: hypothetical protein A2191_02320 [Candidatus Woesebacteria bacterium RIFOXYA1_FULL_38_9]OGM79902.1 MAG: hypothetical protein A2382_03170 [Candidatus Woesebacteria bacterium RIFOXYB1_FULL_38_16]
MMESVYHAPLIYRPSDYWLRLNELHILQISEDFDSFKRSVNMRYFNWGAFGILVHQMRPIAREIIKYHNWGPILKCTYLKMKTKIRMNAVSAFIYKIYVASLYDFVSRIDRLDILTKISEPIIGAPYVIRYKNKIVSQDLCNSVFEFYSATRFLNKNKKLEIAELGAGYGRLAFVFLKTYKNANYTIIDIPAALYISEEYLSKVFPKEKIFHFREFKSFKEVKKEFESARVRIIMAHQIELLPKKYFDLVLSVSTLHEMDTPQIKNFMKQITRICKGFFYTKQWRKSRYSGNGHIKENEYPIPRSWKEKYHVRHCIQRMFFEALYFVGR